MFLVGDKVKLIKPIGKMYDFDKVYTITNIASYGEGYPVVLTFDVVTDMNVSVGVMPYHEFVEYFEPYVEKPKHTWTEWGTIRISEFDDEYDYFEKTLVGEVEYRTNGRRVEVRDYDYNLDLVKAGASCHAEDEFDLNKGLLLAYGRLMVKLIKNSL